VEGTNTGLRSLQWILGKGEVLENLNVSCRGKEARMEERRLEKEIRSTDSNPTVEMGGDERSKECN
jgi:hypothetical protein